MKKPKNEHKASRAFKAALMPFVCTLLLINTSCKHDKNTVTPVTTNSTNSTSFQKVYLVADTSSLGAQRVDTNLVNAWGIALAPNGNFWISSNGKGLAVVYDKNGNSQLSPIAIPFHGDHFGSSPTGVVYNATSGFVIPSQGASAKYIFVTEDGIISAWSSGDSTVTVVDHSASGAVYKGAAMASDGGANFLYVANFRGQKVEVFDQNFSSVSKTFTDPNLPAGYGPFNIKNINGNLYVSYAKLKAPENKDDDKGPGNGYVNIFNPNGTLIKRLASQGTLNSPWGIIKSPNNNILIGNFGDGKISSFDSTGAFLGQLQASNNAVITIDGLWALYYGASGDNNLYFTAGPNEEKHGLFGYLLPSGGSTGGGTGGTSGGGSGGTGGGGGTSGGGGGY